MSTRQPVALSMPMGTSRQKLHRLFEIARTDGFREALDACIHQGRRIAAKQVVRLPRRFLSDWEYIRYKVWKTKVFGRYRAIADPLKVIWVSPDAIQLRAPTLSAAYRWSGTAKVKSGEWDLRAEPFEEHPIYQCFREHFAEGTDWREIPFIRECAYGNRWWRDASTPEAVFSRCEKIDQLYADIEREGIVPASERASTDLAVAIERGEPLYPFLDDITVNIGRDGQLIFVDGKHRLSIAKIQNLESIPVRPLVRHSRWQAFREEIWAADSVSELAPHVRQQLHHPDMRDVSGDLIPLKNASDTRWEGGTRSRTDDDH